MKDITVDRVKFDAVLRRLVNAKPIFKKEISEKIKATKEAKKAAQKIDR